MHFLSRFSGVFRRSLAFAGCITASLLFDQCEKENNYFEEETIIQDAATGQIEAYDALEVDYYIEYLFQHTTDRAFTDGCSTFTNDPIARLITMNFQAPTDPNQFCSYPYGRTRNGIMYVKYSTTAGDSLASRTITFLNYYVSLKQIDGQVDLFNVYRDPVDTLVHASCKFTNFKVSYPDGSSVTFNGIQNRVWTSGQSNGNPLDNTYTVTAVSDSVNRTGPNDHTFSKKITSPILLNFACALSGDFAAVSGVIDIPVISGFQDQQRTVNFGDKTCDNAITVTTSRRTYALSVN